MDDGQSSTKQQVSKKSKTIECVVLVLIILGLISSVYLFLLISPPENPKAFSTKTAEDLSLYPAAFANSRLPETDADRPLFPYSVIPRGATSGSELQAALRRESVVAAHYADFDARHAHIIRLAHDQRAYVSYRLGNQIYWTKKKLTLRAGETLLSDGRHLARTRCGNRVSLVPSAPTSGAEPVETVMSTPIIFPHIVVKPESRFGDPSWPGNIAPPAIFSSDSAPPPPGFGGGFPPFVPVFCCGGSPSTPISPLPQPTPPPTSTPEPHSLMLLLVGLGGVLLLSFWRIR